MKWIFVGTELQTAFTSLMVNGYYSNKTSIFNVHLTKLLKFFGGPELHQRKVSTLSTGLYSHRLEDPLAEFSQNLNYTLHCRICREMVGDISW